jgi:hypothetical protein
VSEQASSAAQMLDRALWLLNELCEDSLEVPLSHVDALERDGVLRDYEVSANFKELRDLIKDNWRV